MNLVQRTVPARRMVLVQKVLFYIDSFLSPRHFVYLELCLLFSFRSMVENTSTYPPSYVYNVYRKGIYLAPYAYNSYKGTDCISYVGIPYMDIYLSSYRGSPYKDALTI